MIELNFYNKKKIYIYIYVRLDFESRFYFIHFEIVKYSIFNNFY